MKCQRLLVICLSTLALSMTVKLTTLSACDHSSQSDTGESQSGSNGSSGNNDSGTSNDAASSSASSAQTDGNTASQDRDGNGPSSFQLIDCSNPIFQDVIPCFERMVKERESYISIP